jgi:hypothetical protein
MCASPGETRNILTLQGAHRQSKAARLHHCSMFSRLERHKCLRYKWCFSLDHSKRGTPPCRRDYLPTSKGSYGVLPFHFIHLVVFLTTGPKPLPKPALHIVRSRASSFKWENPLLSLKSSSSFVRLLPCLPVSSIDPCISPSITRCRRQFLRKMWPIQFAFRFSILCRIFLCSLTKQYFFIPLT